MAVFIAYLTGKACFRIFFKKIQIRFGWRNLEDIPLQPASQRRTKIDSNNLERGAYKEFIDRTVDERLCGFWVSLKKLEQELLLDVKIKHKKERSDWNDPMWSKEHTMESLILAQDER